MKVSIPNNKEWKEQREKRWEEVWVDSYWVDSKEMEVVLEHLKAWYVNGDLKPLMTGPDNIEKQEALSLISIMDLCPIVEVDEYVQFFKDYAFWLSEQKLDYWGLNKNERNNRFIDPFLNRYLNDHEDSNKEIYKHMLKMFLPDENGVITFPFEIGSDLWKPQLKVALCDCAFDILNKLKRYLYGSERNYKFYSHVSIALPIVRYLKDLDPEYFNTKLIDEDSEIAIPPLPRKVVGVGQEVLREILGNLHGYSNSPEEELHCNDIELEKELRTLLDSLSMPEKYYSLIEFIEKHPNNYVEHSE